MADGREQPACHARHERAGGGQVAGRFRPREIGYAFHRVNRLHGLRRNDLIHMKQIIQNIKTGETTLEELPASQVKASHVQSWHYCG